MNVRDALEAELSDMPASVQSSTLAAGARVAAAILDGECGARDAASVLKELRATMAELTKLAGLAPEEADPIDELSRRRASRIADPPVSDSASGGGQ